MHPVEHEFNTTAAIILDAIASAGPLNKRAVMGMVADVSFRAIAKADGWHDQTPPGDLCFDFLGWHPRIAAVPRIQVKRLRSSRGQPLVAAKPGPGGPYRVETQRTRNSKGDRLTRAYRTDEFDILAVSMEPLTGRWTDFLYAPVKHLAKRDNPRLLAIMQPVPAFPAAGDATWSPELSVAVHRLTAA